MPYIITPAHLAAIAEIKTATQLMTNIATWLNTHCPTFAIDTKQEFAHFLAQACHETDCFKTLEEYASGKAYEGRKDLGNTQPGDGVKFKGRGIFQTTGRSNYAQLGIKYGKPNLFLQTPTLLEQPEYAVWSACIYWDTRGLNDRANHPDTDVIPIKLKNGTVINVPPIEYISRIINGGTNGLDDRKKRYDIAKRVLP